ncbi:phospholipase A(1) DAD1, chloroplastic [Amborella trichopoda]|uniref:phospholipase A(1) DAD1, chloroplastic n=1 Tax=Amborella trichopoda TaxID=13333 RepID=UPI0009BD65CC|nr:phospholipase A(1) DAD1, chloroplastic [Amborella trichopoda]|eukprot:XP_006837391.3 phospholipase A(1) DAD1, chloroplastic [Amborella trichopoda]
MLAPQLREGTGIRKGKLGERWKEYQGSKNWEGLLDPLEENMRNEILRYGAFVQAAYTSFNFDPSSPSYASCKFSESSMLQLCGLPETGYRVTRNLHATSGIRPPHFLTKRSSYIGYVAVCQDEEEITRLGRRDVVIAYRGTATCLEWLDNLRSMLTQIPNSTLECDMPQPKVESGFYSLYTSQDDTCPSLSEEVIDEVGKILRTSDSTKPLSITITGHSLGAALAVLTACDIRAAFPSSPISITVISFGGPRVGDRLFSQHLENQGIKILRIVNTHDVVTRVPGIVIDDTGVKGHAKLPKWLMTGLQGMPWVYAEVGQELRVSSEDSPYLNPNDFAMCHDLEAYLHLVDGFLSSACPFRATVKRDFLQLLAAQATTVWCKALTMLSPSTSN